VTARQTGAGLALAVLLVSLALSGAGCARSSRLPATPSRLPVLVDTDMGVDDVLALLYLLGRSDIDVVAVSVAGDGLVRCPVGAANARAVVAAAGHVQVPVACGAAKPLAGQAHFPDAWRAQADQLYGMADKWTAPAGIGTGPADAVSLIARQAVRHPGLRILALGPLTNLAVALRRPDVAATRPRIVVSGGAVNGPGNMPAAGSGASVAEWNIGIDPVAAAEVLRTGLGQQWVTLDATNQVPVDTWFVHTLAAEHRGRAGNAALALLHANPTLSRGGNYFWDPLAAVVITAPTTVTTKQVSLSVRVTGADLGRTVIDPAGTPVVVTTRADPTAFSIAMLDAYRRPGSPDRVEYTPGTPTVLVTRELGAFRLDAPDSLPTGDTTVGFDAATSQRFIVVLGRLSAGYTMADVRAALAHGTTTAPAWFKVVATVDVPTGSRPTWLINLSTGRYAVLAANPDGTDITALGQLTVR
jgi:inosine-uridine nucleoside N-ribohydrolase